jgi:ubiquitin-like modifier-activating enzyme ATG7
VVHTHTNLVPAMQFVPFKSFVDASFFQTLSDRKLNELKLEERKLAIHATYAAPLATDREPSVSLSRSSFHEIEGAVLVSTPTVYYSPGWITNVNTIESFRELDKSRLIRNEAQTIIDSIKDGSILWDPSKLTSFHIASFSDLKKFKFQYWFAFPALSIDYSLVGKSYISAKDKISLDVAIHTWHKSVSCLQRGFFLVKQTPDGYLIGKLSEYKTFFADSGRTTVGFVDPSSVPDIPGWPLRNFMVLLALLGFKNVSVLSYRDHVHIPTPRSFWIDLELPDGKDLSTEDLLNKVTGWERDSNHKLAPKVSDLGSLINPVQLADQAVDLNLKLMKWRIAPSLNLDVIKNNACLLLGAGTLGGYISRALLGWGVRKITFIDNGRVAYSNPVRQPLYNFRDCLDGGVPKAERAAEALRDIYPLVDVMGYDLEIPMAGHPLTNERNQLADYDRLLELIDEHDTIFLLMDSRESRWLPTVVASAKGKLVINVALGFDSYVVMRHGLSEHEDPHSPHLGCYFCNDVVAPVDSISRLTLDQMCTVTRPGVAMVAASSAVELWASLLQHPMKGLAPAHNGEDDREDSTVLSNVPHQIRGFLRNFEALKIWGPSYIHCSACSAAIVSVWREGGWEFVKQALNDPQIVSELSGLAELQRTVQQMEEPMTWTSEDDEVEIA